MRTIAVAVVLAAAVAVPVAHAGRVTIQVTSVTVTVKRTDVPPKGASKGDTVASRDRLLNAKAQFGKRKGAVVGSDRGTLTVTGAHSATFSGTAVLPGGTLRLDGPVAAVGTSIAIPVTGGTGRFAGAKGFVLVGPGKTRSLNTYTLTLPTIPVA
jgi:dirigent-like protein